MGSSQVPRVHQKVNPLIKTEVLFLRHSTKLIFHELEYCPICLKFPQKIAPGTLHTVKQN
jgi:hypothetical protein